MATATDDDLIDYSDHEEDYVSPAEASFPSTNVYASTSAIDAKDQPVLLSNDAAAVAAPNATINDQDKHPEGQGSWDGGGDPSHSEPLVEDAGEHGFVALDEGLTGTSAPSEISKMDYDDMADATEHPTASESLQQLHAEDAVALPGESNQEARDAAAVIAEGIQDATSPRDAALENHSHVVDAQSPRSDDSHFAAPDYEIDFEDHGLAVEEEGVAGEELVEEGDASMADSRMEHDELHVHDEITYDEDERGDALVGNVGEEEEAKITSEEYEEDRHAIEEEGQGRADATTPRALAHPNDDGQDEAVEGFQAVDDELDTAGSRVLGRNLGQEHSAGYTSEGSTGTMQGEVEAAEHGAAESAEGLGDDGHDDQGSESSEPPAVAPADSDEIMGDELMVEVGVTVCYRENDYPLIAQDADAEKMGFFDDASVLDCSILDLLQAFRKELVDEISTDQELVFLVDELGLEFAESTCREYLELTTVRQITQVHAQLVKNQSGQGHRSRGLYTFLFTKPHLSRRLAFLNDCAHSGRGLDAIAKNFSTFWMEEDRVSEEEDEGEQESSEPEVEDELDEAYAADPSHVSPGSHEDMDVAEEHVEQEILAQMGEDEEDVGGEGEVELEDVEYEAEHELAEAAEESVEDVQGEDKADPEHFEHDEEEVGFEEDDEYDGGHEHHASSGTPGPAVDHDAQSQQQLEDAVEDSAERSEEPEPPEAEAAAEWDVEFGLDTHADEEAKEAVDGLAQAETDATVEGGVEVLPEAAGLEDVDHDALNGGIELLPEAAGLADVEPDDEHEIDWREDGEEEEGARMLQSPSSGTKRLRDADDDLLGLHSGQDVKRRRALETPPIVGH